MSGLFIEYLSIFLLFLEFKDSDQVLKAMDVDVTETNRNRLLALMDEDKSGSISAVELRKSLAKQSLYGIQVRESLNIYWTLCISSFCILRLPYIYLKC